MDVFFHASPEERAAARSSLGLSQNAFVAVSTGHLSKLKDPRTVIMAFQSARLGPDACLLMVGDGEERGQCEAHASDQVVFCGRQQNIRPYLAAADVFMSASTTEGMPTALLEALSIGIPACISDIAAHLEVLSVRTDAGEVFRVGEVDDAVLALRRLLPVSSLRRKAAREIATHFSAKDCAKNYLAHYEKILPL
nr:glycosyltransferase [Pacificimonas pallii]